MINFHSVMRLTCDPQLTTLQGGTEMVKFSLAEKTGKGKYERSLWLDCTMFGVRCGTLMEYFKKGDPIQVAGELSTQSWDDSETGKKRYKIELKITDFSFVGGKSDNQQPVVQTQQTLPTTQPKLDVADEVPF